MNNIVLRLGVLCLFFMSFIQLSFANSVKDKDFLGEAVDTVKWMRADTISSRHQSIIQKVKRLVDLFSDVDTNYVEPQQYNFTAMLQNTNTYEYYNINSSSQQSISLAPDASVKVGPYLGWKFIFLGYTLDVRHFSLFSGSKSQRQEYDLSLYTSMIGLDLYYRNTGSDFKIRNIYLGKDIDTEALRGVDFSGLSSTVRGINVYYIFNHRRFSYPAAFSQSTVQRRSAGSPLVGLSYISHKLSVSWDELNMLIHEYIHPTYPTADLDKSIMFEQVKHKDISISGGYAYNWVFKKNWLLAASMSLALAYRTGSADLKNANGKENFDFNKFNINGVGRFAMVYNNSKWYAGISAILNSYNYKAESISTNNSFGNINIYVGLNFGKKKATQKSNKE